MADDSLPSPPAQPIIRPPRRWIPSAIWLVPTLAALIGLSLVVHTLNQRGPTITIAFPSAEGIEANKTKVRFKDVEIGTVTEIHLASDRSRVVASVELKKEAESFAVQDSRFWVVRPRLAGSGVSGLETLLSGSYIGVDAGHSTVEQRDFTGLDTPPVIASDVPGRRFVLVARDIGSLDVGSPIFYRRIPVGHIESFSLQPDGHSIFLSAFVKAPYERFVTDNTRFWHASGVDLRLDAGGIKLNTQSLAALLMGGVAFESPDGAITAPEAATATRFTLAADHDAALKVPDGEAVTLVLRFHQSVRGLSLGAPVDFRGAELGQVRGIDMVYDDANGDFTPLVTVDIYPDRLGAAVANAEGPGKATTEAQKRRRLGELVRRGLRAQLRTGSLVTGQLFVALDFFPTAKPVTFNAAAQPPELPTVPGDFEELYQQVQGIVRKLDKIPFDTIGQDVHQVLVGMESALKRMDGMVARTDREILPELRDSLKAMRASLDGLQAGMAGDGPLQQDTRQALRGMTEATRSLKRLTDSLDRQPESLLRGRKEQTR
ncbi:intermembrane transport protein PqiB [Magnetospirillum sulfuroxidans]|uniref:MCE family protein n=1 Tax=Magnetospirillum sulfuroxidans TaxID=611300 RepID=A0ABS5IFD2_9PROT|nr:MlaD family protein [Magnetospirillum sulfuroxidans]MBR9973139.1 MCE family protein [Magnetospirillum sulfuroxidans]